MRMFVRLLLALVLCGGVQGVVAQGYPSRPVRLIVPTGTGSSADTLARLVAFNLGRIWKTSVVVENMPGAGAVVGANALAKAPGDGYTLGMLSINNSINAAFYEKLPYDLLKDLRGVARLTSSVTLLVAHPSLGVNSVGDLIKLAQSRPGQLNFGSSGNGGLLHLTMELFNQQAGVSITHVPYGSVAQMMVDLLAGRTSVGAASGATALPLLKSGKLKGLVVAAPQRSPFFPDLPSSQEVGLPGFAVSSWLGIAAPAQTPDAVVAKIYGDLAVIGNDAEFRAKMAGNGFEFQLTPGAEMWARVADEIGVWTRLVKEKGLKSD